MKSNVVVRILVVLTMLVLHAAPAVAQEAADKDEEIRVLRARIAELEKQLAATTQPAGPQVAAGAAAADKPVLEDASRAERDALRDKARQRARKDAGKHKPEELAEAESLYQTANKDWRSPEAIVALKQMIEKYPDVNRTGCAVLYLGQMSQGETREEYLKRAVDNHSDSFYFNGVQVGALARVYLAGHYKDIGRLDDAKKLLTEVLMKYPDAITHSGKKLAPIVKHELASLRSGAAH